MIDILASYKHYDMTVSLYRGSKTGEFISIELHMFPYDSSDPFGFDENNNMVSACTYCLYTKDIEENYPEPFTPVPSSVLEELDDAFNGADCVYYVNIGNPHDLNEVYRKYRLLFVR